MYTGFHLSFEVVILGFDVLAFFFSFPLLLFRTDFWGKLQDARGLRSSYQEYCRCRCLWIQWYGELFFITEEFPAYISKY